jgi:hypothetical protein
MNSIDDVALDFAKPQFDLPTNTKLTSVFPKRHSGE